jgi:hypothetical protein
MRRGLSAKSYAMSRASLIFLAGALVCLLAGIRERPARAQISPGPLAKAHQSLSGPTNCSKCHDLGRVTLARGR